MLFKFKSALVISALTVTFAACTGAEGDKTGLEYAPNMYHSPAYEPFSQITDKSHPDYNSSPITDYEGKNINMLKPVEGTVARQNYVSVTKTNQASAEQELLIYTIHKDSIEAGALLKNPIAASDEVLAQGQELFQIYCSPCHGAKGTGDGKVGEKYLGVPNYSTGRYKTLSEGDIFHTITHGRGRMWAHKALLNPEQRWKIVHFVQKLQQGG